MSEPRADTLSPLDAATLWPQLGRLSTEVIATRNGEHLLLNSALAATRLTRLPKMPRTAVLAVKSGLGYRGVVAARELAGGAGWEAMSLRIARDKDDPIVTALLEGLCEEVARRGGRGIYARVPEGSPHMDAVRRAGIIAYGEERLLAMPPTGGVESSPMRAAGRQDRHGVFRLYCRVVPEHVRRQEAPTQQHWRALHDSFDCAHEYVLDGEGTLVAWVGVGGREARVLADEGFAGSQDAALDLVESCDGRHTSVVVMQYQFDLERKALERGYEPLGTRLLCVRQLALMNPLKERVAVPAETVPLPH